MKELLKKSLEYAAKPILGKIHRYKDSCRGETSYLIGGGISLKWFDLKAFSAYRTIPCQYIPLHNEFASLDVEHAILPEPFFFYPYMKGLPYTRFWRNRMYREYKKAIAENPAVNFVLNLSNFFTVRDDNVTFFFRGYHDSRLPDDFITNRILTLGGSLQQSIIFAIYLGIEKVYLVGFDYTHKPSRSLHWFEKGKGIIKEKPEYLKDFLQIAKEYIDITTITLDGSGENLQSVTYTEHTGLQPAFRENYELLSSRHLEVLSEWPGYTIY